MIQLTAVIITLNEEAKIGQCLASLEAIADEIIVVDSYSTDRTEEICHEYNVTFIKQKFLGHIEQKNFALQQATNAYVLSLDADEALSERLRNSILKVKKLWQGDGYCFNRLTYYAGNPIRHCGWYPDKKLRLIKKEKAIWTGVNPHDWLCPLDENATIHFLAGDLLHYSYDSIAGHVKQANYFTSISSREDFARGIRVNAFRPIYRGVWQFFRDYFLLRGFLDGRRGFVVCCINSLAYFLKFEKIYELQKKQHKRKSI